MRTLFIAISIFALGFISAPPKSTGMLLNKQTQDSVWICKSSTAYVYHSTPDCRGLDRCTHPIIKVSLYDAIHLYGRRPCKICE
jgi:hypothetical protein